MTTRDSTFGIRLASIFTLGARGYVRNIVPLSSAGLVTMLVYLAFRVPAQGAADDGRVLVSLALDLVGLVFSGVVAYPWYSYALSAAAGDPIVVGAPFKNYDRFSTQAVASIWFWAGVLLGLRYLFGLPALLALAFYAFYGYVVADGYTDSGLKALGRSAALGEGRRIGLVAIGGLLLIFNLFGAIAVGFGVNPLTITLALMGLLITTNITLVGGAVIYRRFVDLQGSEQL